MCRGRSPAVAVSSACTSPGIPFLCAPAEKILQSTGARAAALRAISVGGCMTYTWSMQGATFRAPLKL